jgi:hypothetical protein
MPLFTAPLSGIAAAITIAAASPAAPTVGLYQNAPVSVVSCEQSNYDLNLLLEGPSSPIHYGNLSISFVNRAALKATGVRFAVSTPSGTETIDDAGTFSTGTRISHEFAPVNGDSFAGATNCAVQSVTFSDGTTWQRS